MSSYIQVNVIYMAISKEKKVTISAKLDEAVKDAETLVFVGFKGLGGNDTTAMRKALRGQGVGYFVAKKTLMKRAFDSASFDGSFPELEGEVAIAYSTDAIAPAQGVREFEKQHKEEISILGGVFQGVYKTKEEMTEIASIPPLPVLRGMFVNVINSPIQGLVLGLNAIADKK